MQKISWARSVCIAAALLFLCQTALWAGGASDTAGGKVPKESGTQYTGGQGISMAIMPLEGSAGITEELLLQLYGQLIHNMTTYSDMEIMNRVNLGKTLKENELELYADDASRLRAGQVLPSDYFLYGNVTQKDAGYSLQFQIEDSKKGTSKAAYSGICDAADLKNYRGIGLASLDLLEKMGVSLTEEAKMKLSGAADEDQIKGQTAFAKGITAKTSVEAESFFRDAMAYDSSLSAEAAALLAERNQARSAMTDQPPRRVVLKKPEPQPELPAKPPPAKTGNIREDAKAQIEAIRIQEENERIRQENEEIRRENERQQALYDEEYARQELEFQMETARIDAQNRQRWVEELQENEAGLVRHLTENPAFELVYTAQPKPGAVNAQNNTMSLIFEAALVPRRDAAIIYRSVEDAVQNLREQILATGKAAGWALDLWPEKSVRGEEVPVIDEELKRYLVASGGVFTPQKYSYGREAPAFAQGNRNMEVEATLMDEGGYIIGTATFSLPWGWIARFSAHRMRLTANSPLLESISVSFDDVPVDAITDTLTIDIARINGIDARASAVPYSANWARWQAIAAQEAAKDSLNTFKNLLPHQIGVGTTFSTPKLTLSVYNTVYFSSKKSRKEIGFFDYGCDFGFIHGLAGDLGGVGYFSFYPNVHIGRNAAKVYRSETRRTKITKVNGVYAGIGGGLMLATYVYQNDTVQVITPALDVKVGVTVGLFDVGYTPRFALKADGSVAANHKWSLGLRIPY